jgi:hypothetical protein
MGKKRNGLWSNSYEHGPFYQGEGFSPISDEISERIYTKCLPAGEFLALLALNRFVWKKRCLIADVASELLAKFGIPLRTAERFLSPNGRLRQHGFIRRTTPGRTRINEFFVEPVFIWSSMWHELEHIEKSRLMQILPRLEDRQIGGTDDALGGGLGTVDRQSGGSVDARNSTPAKMAEENRQDGGDLGSAVGMDDRQNGGHSKADLFIYTDAPRRRRAGGMRGPGKGVRLSANAHERRKAALVAQARANAEREAREKNGLEG